MTDIAPLEVLPAGEETVEETEDDDDPDAAHIVTQEDLIHSQLTGQPIQALCGKWWVPKRNPDEFPLCQACVEIFNSLS
jgi:hypothetical protein